MPYAQIPEEFPRAYREAGPAGRGFFIDVLCWCNEHRTDGFLADADLRHVSPGERYPRKMIQRLSELGCFDRQLGGWQIPPPLYRTFNLTREDLDYAARAARRRRLPGNAPPRSRLNARSVSSRFHANSVQARESDASVERRAHSPTPVVISNGLGNAREREADELFATADAYEKLGRPDLAKVRRADAEKKRAEANALKQEGTS
jgi:hypothetical protein